MSLGSLPAAPDEPKPQPVFRLQSPRGVPQDGRFLRGQPVEQGSCHPRDERVAQQGSHSRWQSPVSLETAFRATIQPEHGWPQRSPIRARQYDPVHLTGQPNRANRRLSSCEHLRHGALHRRPPVLRVRLDPTRPRSRQRNRN